MLFECNSLFLSFSLPNFSIFLLTTYYFNPNRSLEILESKVLWITVIC